jgi:hypothetical protein
MYGGVKKELQGMISVFMREFMNNKRLTPEVEVKEEEGKEPEIKYSVGEQGSFMV